MLFKAVLFDMDGTLVDSVDDVADSMNIVLSKHDLPDHPVKNYINWIGDGMENLVISALPKNYRKSKFIKECLSEMKTTYSEMWLNKTHLFSGIAELLSALRENNIKLAVLSNKPHTFTKEIADKLLSQWKFDAIMGLKEGHFRKPDPTSALEISKQIKVVPSNFIYVGDSSTDIKTAINAGMLPVGVSWGYRTTDSLIKSGAKFVINTPEELLSLIR
jgi:phosphoglycolate phosphatase